MSALGIPSNFSLQDCILIDDPEENNCYISVEFFRSVKEEVNFNTKLIRHSAVGSFCDYFTVNFDNLRHRDGWKLRHTYADTQSPELNECHLGHFQLTATFRENMTVSCKCEAVVNYARRIIYLTRENNLYFCPMYASQDGFEIKLYSKIQCENHSQQCYMLNRYSNGNEREHVTKFIVDLSI
jgi:hypothetical protein